jgi:hypothetical protein
MMLLKLNKLSRRQTAMYRADVLGMLGTETSTAGGNGDVYNPPKLVDGELQFNVFAMGTRGAGKTAFLAALYHQLSVQDIDGNNFFVELQSSASKRFLVKTYEALTAPEVDWPPGSAVVSEYEFRCCYFMAGETLPLFRFRYVDFPGGFLTDEMDGADSFNIGAATQEAHSILVLIDGQKILQSIEGLPVKGPSLNGDLSILVPLLVRCAHRPVHFIITKWDILKSCCTLAQVRGELLKNTEFDKFVRLRTSQRLPLHLVPVSAVGDDFATFDRTEMRMKKRKDGKAKPYNVDLSVGLTITDQLLLLKSHPGYRDLRPYLLRFLKVLGLFVKSLRFTADLLALPSIVRVDKVVDLMDSTYNAIEGQTSRLKEEIEKTVRTIKNQRSAVEAIIMIQAMQRSSFEQQFPESILSRAAR